MELGMDATIGIVRVELRPRVSVRGRTPPPQRNCTAALALPLTDIKGEAEGALLCRRGHGYAGRVRLVTYP